MRRKIWFSPVPGVGYKAIQTEKKFLGIKYFKILYRDGQTYERKHRKLSCYIEYQTFDFNIYPRD